MGPTKPGRGHSGGRHSGGRGWKPKDLKAKEKELKFAPQSQHQNGKYASFTTVREAIKAKIQKDFTNGSDVAKSIKDEKLFDMKALEPQRLISTGAGGLQSIEQAGYDIRYQEELRRYLDRKDLLEENMRKAYTMIMTSYCTRTMQQRVEEHPDFVSQIDDDPIKLIEVIKTLLHDPVRAQYPLISVTDALYRWINSRQQDDEDLLDYAKRRKQLTDTVKAQVGNKLFHYYVENTEEYKTNSSSTEKDELLKSSFEKVDAYLLLRGADRKKYGELMKGFVNQYSLGNDQYPKTKTGAIDVLSNHQYDKDYYDQRAKARKIKADKDKEQQRKITEAEKAASFAQGKTMICYCCGKAGHLSPDCKDKNKPKNKWHVQKAMHQQHLQDQESDNDSDEESVQSVQSTSSRSSRRSRRGNVEETTNVTWSGFQNCERITEARVLADQTGKFDGLRNKFLLDTGSTMEATVTNKNLCTNPRKSEIPVLMKTNAGTRRLDTDVDIPGMSDAKFDSHQIANIFGFSHMVDKYRITFDSAKEDAFTVYMPERKVKFERDGRLYSYTPTNGYVKRNKKQNQRIGWTGSTEEIENTNDEYEQSGQIVNTIESVEDNTKRYTEREFQQAKRARKLYHGIGGPTVTSFKRLIRANGIKNCPVTGKDANVAEDIFGKDIGEYKGKTVRKKPTVVRNDNVLIPKALVDDHNDLIYCIDIMYVNGMPMLTGIDKSIRYRSLVPLNTRTSTEIYSGLDKMLRNYNLAGFGIKEIRCDREFRPIMDEVKDDMGIVMHYPPAGDHVPEAERNNRVIGERVRATTHRLPFQVVPKIMSKYMAMVNTSQLNFFPVKGGVSEHYSPHTIMKKTAIEYDDVKIPFGSYVQAVVENDIKNDNKPRTVDAIFLRATIDTQTGFDVMNLVTGRHMTTPRVYELPITPLIIETVENMAKEQGIKSLKIQGRNKQPLLPVDWIAGMDYDFENDDESDDDSEQSDDESDDESENEEDDDDEDGNGKEANEQAEIDQVYEDENRQEDEANPTIVQNDEEEVEEPAETEEEQDVKPNIRPDRVESQHESPTRNKKATIATLPASDRPTRNVKAPDIFVSHKQFAQTMKNNKKKVRIDTVDDEKKVTFEDAERHKLEMNHNINVENVSEHETTEYTLAQSLMIARVMSDINSGVQRRGVKFAQVHAQQYMLQKGLKKYGKRGQAGAEKELEQLHKRTCFTPLDVSKLSSDEKEKAMNALMFLSEKKDKTVKGRLVYNGKPTREWLSKEEASSPTVQVESIFMTAVIDAKEDRDVMTADIPNAFIQAHMPKIDDGDERVVMKITGVLVDLLVKLAPETYGPYVVYEKGKRVIYVQVIRALYGMLIAALLWYNKFRKDLEGIGFKFNAYDPCVANRNVRGKQHTVRFHVDDIMSSHKRSTVNSELLKWLNEQYGTHGKVKATRGKLHDYLGMTFDFNTKGKVKIGMIKHIEKMLDDFKAKYKLDGTAKTPAGSDLFHQGSGEELERQRKEDFHTFTAKSLFVCKRARPDTQPTVSGLTTRVRCPIEDDWKKLLRLLKYFNGTRKDVLTLSTDNPHVLKWYVDASFAVHPDFKSHSGAVMTMGKGAVIAGSIKQRLNTTSSCEAELVGAHDFSPKIIWTKLFMEEQGYQIKKNILYQDNKSTILLINNGRRSSGKRTRALNVRYFYLTNQQEIGNVSVEYCPTGKMTGDFMTKPLQGRPFRDFRNEIMGVG